MSDSTQRTVVRRLRRQRAGWQGTALFFSILSLALPLAGCGERELMRTKGTSARAIAELMEAGIPAHEEESSGTFRLLVPESDYALSVEVLENAGLLNRDQDEVRELLAPRGFIPPEPEVAVLRYNTALAREAERLLLALPAVVDARLTVRTQGTDGPAAFGIVRFAGPTASPPFSAAQLKDILRSVVPDLTEERTQIRIYRTDPSRRRLLGQKMTKFTFPFSFLLPVEHVARAKREFAALLLLLGVCTGTIGLLIGLVIGERRGRRRGAAPRPKKSTQSFIVERSNDERHNKVSNALH